MINRSLRRNLYKHIKQKNLFLTLTCFCLFFVTPLSSNWAAGVSSNNPYANADLMLSSVLNHYQYPLPANITENQNTHLLDFTNAQPDPKRFWRDEVRYVAAFSFCQRLTPMLPTPPHGSSLSSSDIQALADSKNNIAARSAALEECMAAVSYRTACPANNSTLQIVNGGGTTGMDCHKTQAAMCHFLKDDQSNGGMGITRVTISGNGEEDNALADCDEIGLSPAMYDRIFSHRCDSAAYTQNLPNALNADSSMIEHVISFECQAAKDAFEAKMDREREGILIAIQTLIQLRGIGHVPDVTSHGTSSSGSAN